MSCNHRSSSLKFAGKDVSECAGGVVQRLAVDRTVQVLNEDVAYPGAAWGGVALVPHDAARAASAGCRKLT